MENSLTKNSNKKNNDKVNLNKDNKEKENNKEFTNSNKNNSDFKKLKDDNAEVKEINHLKFDGLFLDMSKYDNEKKEKNPFEGPSPYIELYKEVRDKIMLKISGLAFNEKEKSEK